MLFLTDLRQHQPKNSISALHHSFFFFPESLEKEDSTVCNHGAEVKDFTKQYHEKIETMYRKTAKPKKRSAMAMTHTDQTCMPMTEIA